MAVSNSAYSVNIFFKSTLFFIENQDMFLQCVTTHVFLFVFCFCTPRNIKNNLYIR